MSFFRKLREAATLKMVEAQARTAMIMESRGFVSEERGQLSLNRLLGIVILILVFVALLPTIQSQVNLINSSIGASSATVTINSLIPLFLSIAMLITILRSTGTQ